MASDTRDAGVAARAKSPSPPAPPGSSGSRDLEVVSVSKSYGGPDAVRDLTLTLHHGEFLTLLGPSGSGKTTTLLMVAGFERPSGGDIRVGGRSVLNDPPQRRNFGIVFQSYALFPHMSVLENVEFPLRMRGVARRARRAPALDMLDKVGLRGFEGRKPRALSGGQQQRVALARALVFDPDALLLDEPLGALDKRLREAMQIEIKAIQRRVGISVLYVTHDQEEAMVMSDRIAIMRDGRIVQIGPPRELYKHPATPFVANFLGETNLLSCRLIEAGAYGKVTFADGSSGLATAPRSGSGDGRGQWLVSVRPEQISLLSPGEHLDTTIDGVVKDCTFVGSYVRATIQACQQEMVLKGDDTLTARAQPGRPIRIGWRKDDAQLLSAE